MLIIARWQGQKIVIDGQVWVEINSVSANGRVILGVTAPRVITVDREEIYLKKLEQENPNAKR